VSGDSQRHEVCADPHSRILLSSYFSISLGTLKFGGYSSPRTIGPNHAGPTRMSKLDCSARLLRVCRRSYGC
jgi:hypothetical protein